jgi:Fic-DOC domain mobile mystery protein B
VTGFETVPGETPIDDRSGLKVEGITTRAELNQVEAENIRKAVVKYLAGKPSRRTARFDLEWALRLHREMLGDVWAWAGGVRITVTNIGVAPQQIRIALQSLMDDLAHWQVQGIDLLEQAVWLHHRAVRIHPFENGNGRWARLLANIWLKLHDHPPTEWPEATVGTESVIRAEYIAAIKRADDGDYGPLLDLHQRYTEEA